MRSTLANAVPFAAGLIILAACDKDLNHAVNPLPQHDVTSDAEGEVLVQVFENGVPTTATNLTLQLVPLGDTESRLHGTNTLTMPIGKKRENNDWHAEWFDPDASDGPCGPIENYDTGDDDLRGPEEHGGGGKEVHCIRPGRYTAILRREGQEVWESDIEYVQLAVNEAGGREQVWIAAIR